MAQGTRTVAPRKLVRLKAPPGISHVQTITGDGYMVLNGYVNLPEEEATPLLAAGFSF
jgi:hypothetical protein